MIPWYKVIRIYKWYNVKLYYIKIFYLTSSNEAFWKANIWVFPKYFHRIQWQEECIPSRMHTVRCGGRLSCHTRSPYQAHPPSPCMPPFAMHISPVDRMRHLIKYYLSTTTVPDGKNICHYGKSDWTCHLLCKRPGCYHSASKTADRNFEAWIGLNSVISDSPNSVNSCSI